MACRICDNNSKRKPEDQMEDLDVNTLMLRMPMSVTQAAVHLGNAIIWRIYIQPKISYKEQ